VDGDKIAEAGRRAIFLDRDGVINEPVIRNNTVSSPRLHEEFVILGGVKEACLLLRELDFVLVIATNQPDVGRRLVSRQMVEQWHQYLIWELGLQRVMVCFHAGDSYGEKCSCRKPLPGMLVEASRELNVDLNRSYMVGDRSSDIECGYNAGCKTVLVGGPSGLGRKTRDPDFYEKDLLSAAKRIASEERMLK
jgi:D-glycero-D-manno-heptose 1,7-bisphosphate phosphatase